MAFAFNINDAVPLAGSDVALGKPIAFNIYDVNQKVLVERGFTIQNEFQLERLLKKSPFRPAFDIPRFTDYSADLRRKTLNTYELIEYLIGRLNDCFRIIFEVDAKHNFCSQLLTFCLSIQEYCEQAPNALLGGLHLADTLPHTLAKHLNATIICELIGKRVGLSAIERLPLIAAAATHDIGLLSLQDELAKQDSPLSPYQKRLIQEHPTRGSKLLQMSGVDDKTWLTIVEQHHERSNGTGYPNQIKGKEMHRLAKIVALTDIYTGMIRYRAQRKALPAHHALKKIFSEDGSIIDRNLTQIFIDEVGLHPPGSLIQLDDGKLGVVVSCQKGAQGNIDVAVVTGEDNLPLTNLKFIPLNAKQFSLTTNVPREKFQWLFLNVNELWPAIKWEI